ncbi:endonuclease domain-containing protein [Deinococcus roseus]|nr:endonuclease domain-containing protein [Deinococcus roseus]
MGQSRWYRNYNPALNQRAQRMRWKSTPAESLLWNGVLKHLPVRFLRQRVIGNYIADFYCARLRLIIEVDGAQHYTPEGLAYDAIRTAFFEGQGIRVIRFTNREVMRSLPVVKGKIEALVEDPPLHALLASDPLEKG